MGFTCQAWPLDPLCLPADWDPHALTPAQTAAVEVASELLKAASGYWVGQCAVTVRPCGPAGQDVCTGPCGCTPVCRVRLPAPATGIVAVEVDGVPLPPGATRIDDMQWLVRQDGGACFPRCQRLDLPLGAVGTWGVTYLRGMPVDAAARRAVTALAVRIAADCGPGGSCSIDPRTTRLTRQNVTYDLTPASEQGSVWLSEPVVRDWLAVVNPQEVSAPLVWWTPEMGYVATPTVTPPRAGLGLTVKADGLSVTATVTGEAGPVWVAWGDGVVT